MASDVNMHVTFFSLDWLLLCFLLCFSSLAPGLENQETLYSRQFCLKLVAISIIRNLITVVKADHKR